MENNEQQTVEPINHKLELETATFYSEKEETTRDTVDGKEKIVRCMEWLQKQNTQDSEKLSLQNQNDIQFIIQTNADRKKFLLSAAEDVATVPSGIDEATVDPKPVPIHRLRVDNLRIECEWQSCKWYSDNYTTFQKHVKGHIPDLHVIENNGTSQYVCLWDVCGHKTSDSDEIVRHVNYHAYHARLLAIGFNARATLSLACCTKDSSKRNQLPPLPSPHVCMWTDCGEKFSAIQTLFEHVRQHAAYSPGGTCSWAGCGAAFPRRAQLAGHARAHTGERLVACYHCGHHFASNRKLSDHLLRQNVDPRSEHQCNICGSLFASAYLSREHARQHVSQHACTLCDMSAPSLAALAQHVRYRHIAHSDPDTRPHACPDCDYRAVTKSDLKQHLRIHNKKKKNSTKEDGKGDSSDEDSIALSEVKKKPKEKKKYACHMCPKNKPKIFSRGTRLTTHLVKVHGAQWPFGHSRFRYQISDDGMYRLTTTRYEILEVSKKIVDGYSGPKDSITNSFEFNLELKAEPTLTTPRRFEITLKNSDGVEQERKPTAAEPGSGGVEITMCDVDEHGNIISSEIIKSGVVFT